MRNIIIALASAVWLIPFYISAEFALTFLEIQEKFLIEKEYGNGACSFSYMEISIGFFIIMAILLAVTVISWAFVAANKLWPIKGNSKDEQKSE